MTPEPDTEVDEDRKTVDLVVKIDQQVQYRVGRIEFLGVNAVTREKLMESLPKPGGVFASTNLDDSFKINRTTWPPDVSREDEKVGWSTKIGLQRICFDGRVV